MALSRNLIHTIDHKKCPACDEVRNSMRGASSSEQVFPLAAEAWLREHKRYIKLRTYFDYQQYFKALNKFFGNMIVKDIDLANVRAYQDHRSQFAGNQRINIELSALHQVLEEAGCWEKIGASYRPLPTDHRGAGQSLTPEDEEAIIAMAFRRRSQLLAHCLRLMFRTGCGFGEIRRMKRQDVDLQAREIAIVEGAKNRQRQRQVPLIDGSFESMEWLWNRCEQLGGHQPTDYILPCQPRRRFGSTDFRRPMTSIKRAWWTFKAEIKEADPELYKRIETFRIYDCRVTAVTRALSSGKMSEHTAKRIFGHSKQMQDRYFKPEREFIRDSFTSAMGGKRA